MNRRGQATTEYIILLAAVVSAYVILARGFAQARVAERLTRPVREEFASAYRYGHTKAKGFEDGGPINHPRVTGQQAGPGGGAGNFRIFINTRKR